MAAPKSKEIEKQINLLGVKKYCKVATTTNITLSGLQTIDGVTLLVNDEVLVKEQTDSKLNGPYVVSNGAWTRRPDFDESFELVPGCEFYILEGNISAGYKYDLDSNKNLVIGIDPITFKVAAGASVKREISIPGVTITNGRLAVNHVDFDPVNDKVDFIYNGIKKIPQIEFTIDAATKEIVAVQDTFINDSFVEEIGWRINTPYEIIITKVNKLNPFIEENNAVFLDKVEWSKTISADTPYVLVDLGGFDPIKDRYMAYLTRSGNTSLILKANHTLETVTNKFTLTGGFKAGDTFVIVVFKNVRALNSNFEFDMSYIKPQCITQSHLNGALIDSLMFKTELVDINNNFSLHDGRIKVVEDKLSDVFQAYSHSLFCGETKQITSTSKLPTTPTIAVTGRHIINLLGKIGSFAKAGSTAGLAQGVVADRSASFSLINGEQTFTPTAQYGNIQSNSDSVVGVAGKRYIIISEVKTTDNQVYPDASTGAVITLQKVHSGSGNFETIYKLLSTPSANIFFAFAVTSKTSGFVPITVRKPRVFCIDDMPELTGKTNQEIVDYCLAIPYFEGMGTVINPTITIANADGTSTRTVIEGEFRNGENPVFNNGKITYNRLYKKTVVLGKDYDWQYAGGYVGMKAFMLPQKTFGKIKNGGLNRLESFMFTPDGKQMLSKWDGGVADSFFLWGSDDAVPYSLVASISDTVTGFTETLAPSNDAVKALFNGWKAKTNNGTQYTSWKSISKINNGSLAINDIVLSPFSTIGNGNKTVQLSNGWRVVAVLNGTVDIRIYVAKDKGSAWELLAKESLAGSECKGLSITNVGNVIHLLFTLGSSSPWRVYAYKFDAATWTMGNELTGEYTLDTQSAIGSCDMIAHTDGSLHATWSIKTSSHPNSFNIMYSKSSDGGLNWSAPTKLSTMNNNYYNYYRPVIIIAQDGYPLVVCDFLNTYGSNNAQIVRFKFNGTAWSEAVIYDTQNAYVQESVSAVIDTIGVIHLSWHGKDATNPSVFNVYYTKSTDNGLTWSKESKLTTGNSQNLSDTSIGLGKNNSIFIYFNGGHAGTPTTSQIQRIKKVNDEWGAVEIVTNSTTNHQWYPQVVNYNEDEPSVIWLSNTEGVKIREYADYAVSDSIDFVKNNVAPGFEGWQLTYLLETPEPVTQYLTDSDIPKIKLGESSITVENGIFLKEPTTPMKEIAPYYWINSTYPGLEAGKLRHPNETILQVYRNNAPDSLWNLNHNGNGYAYGKSSSVIDADKFDKSAKYYADYRMLKVKSPNIGNVSISFEHNIIDAITDLGEIVSNKQDKHLALQNLIDASEYEVITTRDFYWNKVTASMLIITFNLTMLPKIQMPIPTIINDRLHIHCLQVPIKDKFAYHSMYIEGTYARIAFFTQDSTTITNILSNGVDAAASFIMDARGGRP